LCEEARIDSLSLLFFLLSRVGGIEQLKACFVNFVVVWDTMRHG
jgi:hypothetical protein